ncbi:hypothetical protein [Ruegeria arenilitoris]|uniref:hypothetical protein n=1 Tax=Ruegeria arenilitoris TaxID=1173585 RepID=UPI00147D77D4|nr:hypothetical protein [Ruegeria arenilitoris]
MKSISVQTSAGSRRRQAQEALVRYWPVQPLVLYESLPCANEIHHNIRRGQTQVNFRVLSRTISEPPKSSIIPATHGIENVAASPKRSVALDKLRWLATTVKLVLSFG